jgi:DNA-binding response OmpR family regulator
MSPAQDYLADLEILAVDDENDILETIEDLLDSAKVDCARDYETALAKIGGRTYDLAILDIMGVNGLELLDKTVAKGIPTVMLTAHAINPETLMASIRKGAIAYLPKETLAELDELLNALLAAQAAGTPPWKLLFDRLGAFFDDRFGPDWRSQDEGFWTEFSRTWAVGSGIRERLSHDPRLADKL